MSEGNTPTPGEGSDPAGNKTPEFVPITTQEDFDKHSARIRKSTEAKYANFEEYKAAAEKLAQIEAEGKTDLQKALERAEAAEAKAKAYEGEKQIAAWKAEVASEKGVPADILVGSTKEELEAHAEKLAQYIKKDVAPINPGEGQKTPPVADQGDWLRDKINKR